MSETSGPIRSGTPPLPDMPESDYSKRWRRKAQTWSTSIQTRSYPQRQFRDWELDPGGWWTKAPMKWEPYLDRSYTPWRLAIDQIGSALRVFPDEPLNNS